MSKTIEQLRGIAAQIEESTRQGENTQLRVGGLFIDLIDFIAQIPVTETVLGPLLTALNNSELINPGDGQTLTFSLMRDGWAFSDALTQLQIKLGQITSTVTSNYESSIQAMDSLQRQIEATDERVRNYRTDYDNSQMEYSTWRSQTDSSISDIAVVVDKNTGDILSQSQRITTAFDQLDSVTNNQSAADKALEKLFNLTGLDYDDPSGSYSASWLYKNRQGIYGAAANFDANGNIIQSSTLATTVNGINANISNVDGRVTSLSATVDGIQTRVGNAEGTYSQIIQMYNQVEARVTTAEGKVGSIGIAIEDFVTEDEMGNAITRQITNAKINADQISFTGMTVGWTVKNGSGDVVFNLDPNGNLKISGDITGGNITGNVGIGSGDNKMYIRPSGANGAELVGIKNDSTVLTLGFNNEDNPFLQLGTFGGPLSQLGTYNLRLSANQAGIYLTAVYNSMATFETENGQLQVGCTSYGLPMFYSKNGWPSESDVSAGYLYKDSSGFIKVKS